MASLHWTLAKDFFCQSLELKKAKKYSDEEVVVALGLSELTQLQPKTSGKESD